jgi:hypothetical protein
MDMPRIGHPDDKKSRTIGAALPIRSATAITA